MARERPVEEVTKADRQQVGANVLLEKHLAHTAGRPPLGAQGRFCVYLQESKTPRPHGRNPCLFLRTVPW